MLEEQEALLESFATMCKEERTWGGHGAGPLRVKHRTPRKVKAPPPPSSSSPRTMRIDVQYYYTYFFYMYIIIASCFHVYVFQVLY
jgi:hypothetical protein